MGTAPLGATELEELLEDGLDGHLLAGERLGHGVPEHGVLEVVLAERVALGRLEVVHQREDALALGGVDGDEQHDDDELE